jgi:hypothetical protein
VRFIPSTPNGFPQVRIGQESEWGIIAEVIVGTTGPYQVRHIQVEHVTPTNIDNELLLSAVRGWAQTSDCHADTREQPRIDRAALRQVSDGVADLHRRE